MAAIHIFYSGLFLLAHPVEVF